MINLLEAQNFRLLEDFECYVITVCFVAGDTDTAEGARADGLENIEITEAHFRS
jgi:hypothetical protein